MWDVEAEVEECTEEKPCRLCQLCEAMENVIVTFDVPGPTAAGALLALLANLTEETGLHDVTARLLRAYLGDLDRDLQAAVRH